MQVFKPIEPFESGYLKVDDIHEIYYEVSGNPDGKPIFYVHGVTGWILLAQNIDNYLILSFTKSYFLIKEEQAKVNHLHVLKTTHLSICRGY